VPTAKRKRRHLVIIQAYIDESGGKGQGSVFAFSALIASAKDWDGFSNDWQSRLDEHPRIKYFKMHEAAKFKGQFQGWSLRARNEKLRRLCEPIQGLVELFCVLDLGAFAKTLAAHSYKPMDSPYFYPFHIIIMAIALEMIDLGVDEPFEIFFDEHVIFGPAAKSWYPIVRASVDDDMRAVMPVEPFFRSDSDTLPLQAADMTAWLRRRWNNEGLEKSHLKWLESELSKRLIPAQNSQYLDQARMEKIVKQSYSPEIQEKMQRSAAQLDEQLGPDWPSKFRKPKMSKPAAEFKHFDQTMEQLLKVPHSKIKAQLDAAKSGKAKKRKPKTSASRDKSDAGT
jgi:hypothetical protein